MLYHIHVNYFKEKYSSLTYFMNRELPDGEIIPDHLTSHLDSNVAVLLRLMSIFWPVLTTLFLRYT